MADTPMIAAPPTAPDASTTPQLSTPPSPTQPPHATPSVPTLPPDIPPVVANRIQVHDARTAPLQEEETMNEEAMNHLFELEQDREKRGQERAEKAERELAETREELRLLKERLAEKEREEALFSQEHQRHDAELQRLIEKNRDLTRRQLELIKKMLGKS